jgi:hypothetical protein
VTVIRAAPDGGFRGAIETSQPRDPDRFLLAGRGELVTALRRRVADAARSHAHLAGGDAASRRARAITACRESPSRCSTPGGLLDGPCRGRPERCSPPGGRRRRF